MIFDCLQTDMILIHVKEPNSLVTHRANGWHWVKWKDQRDELIATVRDLLAAECSSQEFSRRRETEILLERIAAEDGATGGLTG